MTKESAITDGAAEKIESLLAIFREYAHRSDRPLETVQVSPKFQLELMGTLSEDRLDKKICPWDEFGKATAVSKSFYQAKPFDAVKAVYVTNALEKQRVEERQLELYRAGNEKN